MGAAFSTVGVGFLLCLISIAMSFNTSMGGTRSDHNDGSEVVGYIGLFAIVVGIIWSAVEVWRWLT